MFALTCGEAAGSTAVAPPVCNIEAEVQKAYGEIEAEMSFQILEPAAVGFQGPP